MTARTPQKRRSNADNPHVLKQKWYERDTYRQFNVFRMGRSDTEVINDLRQQPLGETEGWSDFQAENTRTNMAPTSCLFSTFVYPFKKYGRKIKKCFKKH
mmetsp:Transcript_11/g.14  ORF Transcript_11/g.14 Transcript_11/m.14 type:complete len:100 (+) Transcript_11:158-457(+)